MITKTCKQCNLELPADTGFYANDSKCKECRKARVRENRKYKIEHYRQYDRKRGNRQPAEYLAEYRKKYPNKYRAHTLLNNHLRDGNISKKPCEVCGSSIGAHGHHDDYLVPLDVRWLCAVHHSQWHQVNGEGANP
jgi:hypothetical protein